MGGMGVLCVCSRRVRVEANNRQTQSLQWKVIAATRVVLFLKKLISWLYGNYG